jgi:hypothetical protein
LQFALAPEANASGAFSIQKIRGWGPELFTTGSDGKYSIGVVLRKLDSKRYEGWAQKQVGPK